MTMIHIDSGPITHLPLCSCGWRGHPAISRSAAHDQAAAHEARAHQDNTAARRAAREHARRNSF